MRFTLPFAGAYQLEIALGCDAQSICGTSCNETMRTGTLGDEYCGVEAGYGATCSDFARGVLNDLEGTVDPSTAEAARQCFATGAAMRACLHTFVKTFTLKDYWADIEGADD